MQAIILAAGKGSRLKELTNNQTKSMVKINGVSMIERLLMQLDDSGLTRIVIVDGYKADIFEEYIGSLSLKTPIEFITNIDFDITNNIKSFELTKKYWDDETIFFESDLIFSDIIIKKIISSNASDFATVAHYEDWMDGTVVTVNNKGFINNFIGRSDFSFDDKKSYFKTVNVYRMSKDFLNSTVKSYVENQCEKLGLNEYYETTFKTIVSDIPNSIKIFDIGDSSWYEVDNKKDLDIAESIFEKDSKIKLKKFQSRYGGYWRYPQLIDFCYIVNPFFPNDRFIEEYKSVFSNLLIDYPSGQNINNLLAADYFGVEKNCITVGNGAAELINALMQSTKGKHGIIVPTFEEYSNRLSEENVVRYVPNKSNYRYTAQNIINYFTDKKIENLILINPDNPSGNYLNQSELQKIFKWSSENGIILVLDESFIDFAEDNNQVMPTSINQELLTEYPNLVILKSISKSYGVPGLRLGVLATSNKEIMKSVNSRISIWNINSFGEYFFQIMDQYKDEFKIAIEKFYEVRRNLKNGLEEISYLNVLDSQANYFMCEVIDGMKATELVENLLYDQQLFIKDLSNKKGIIGEYVRIAIRRPEENAKLLKLLKVYEKSRI